MKTFSAGLLNFLKTAKSYNRADLFAITLANGQVIRATSSQYNITYNSNIYYSSKNGAWQRGKITSEASFDLRSNDMDLTVMAPGTVTFPIGIGLTQLGSDNFNRANVNPLGSPWIAAGANPLPQLLSNAVSPASTSVQFDVALFSGVSWPNDQECQARLVQLKPNSGYWALVLRSDSTFQNAYYIDLDASFGFGGVGISTPLNLQKFVGGVLQGPPYHQFGQVFPQIGDVFTASIIGPKIFVYRNGVQVGTFTDPTPLTSGTPGFVLQTVPGIVSASDIALDDWAGSGSSQAIGPTLMAAAQLGLFDAAFVQIWTAYWPIDQQPNPFVASWGVETKYAGYIKPNGEITRSMIKFQVADGLYILNQKLPRNLIQAGCRHTLFDTNEFAVYGTRTNCTLSPASFSSAIMTVASGSTRQSINTTATLGQAPPYFTQGYITFLRGQNAGFTFTIKQQTSTTNLLLAAAVPLPLAIGDTFTAFAGCDKTEATCQNKFNNLIHFGGTPFVPNPEVAI